MSSDKTRCWLYCLYVLSVCHATCWLRIVRIYCVGPSLTLSETRVNGTISAGTLGSGLNMPPVRLVQSLFSLGRFFRRPTSRLRARTPMHRVPTQTVMPYRHRPKARKEGVNSDLGNPRPWFLNRLLLLSVPVD